MTNFKGHKSLNEIPIFFSTDSNYLPYLEVAIRSLKANASKDSFSIKKNWITKNREEKFSQRLSNSCIAFSFGPEQENFFIIDEKLMRYLVEKLEEDNE